MGNRNIGIYHKELGKIYSVCRLFSPYFMLLVPRALYGLSAELTYSGVASLECNTGTAL